MLIFRLYRRYEDIDDVTYFSSTTGLLEVLLKSKAPVKGLSMHIRYGMVRHAHRIEEKESMTDISSLSTGWIMPDHTVTAVFR